MKREVKFFAGCIIVWMLLGYSCKHQIFLKQKYVHGNPGASAQVHHTKSFIKKTETEVLHQPNTSVDEKTKIVEPVLTDRAPEPKMRVTNILAGKIRNTPLLRHSVDAIPFTVKLLKTTKAVKPGDHESRGEHIFKVILLTVAFWVVMGMLYSPVLATQVASLAVTFHILAYVLLAVVVWLTIYYLFRVFGKNAIKS